MSPTSMLARAGVAFLLSVSLTLFLRRVRSCPLRYQAAIPFAVAIAGGALATIPWADLVPERHFQWSLPLVLLAAVIGAALVAEGLSSFDRLVLQLSVLVPAALTLVPTWDELWPVRWVSIAAVAIGASALTSLVDGLGRRLRPVVLLGALTLTSTALAGLIADAVSLTYGLTALTPALALCGGTSALWNERDGRVGRALSLAYSINVVGWAYISAIEPQPPVWPLLAIPWTPLVLVPFAVGPLSRMQGIKTWLLPLLLVTVTLAGMGVWIHRQVQMAL